MDEQLCIKKVLLVLADICAHINVLKIYSFFSSGLMNMKNKS